MYRAPAANILVTAFSGKIFGLDRASGTIVWSTELESYGGEVELAIDETVIIACTRTRLTMLEYRTGRLLAQVELVGEHPRRPTMIVDGGQILVARNGEVACYGTNGQALWLQGFSGMGFGSVSLGVPGKVRQADDPGSK